MEVAGNARLGKLQKDARLFETRVWDMVLGYFGSKVKTGHLGSYEKCFCFIRVDLGAFRRIAFQTFVCLCSFIRGGGGGERDGSWNRESGTSSISSIRSFCCM
jgi:hypothetical protein